jgi:carbon-monoxide dehydrogenase medium subunit
MKPIGYLAPATLDEAVHALSGHSDARILAGGTDLIVQLKNDAPRHRDTSLVVDVKRIPELTSIRMDETGLHLGAAASCIKIANHPDVRTHYPALVELASLIGGTAIQGRASIGGNLCNASPSADSIPLLIAYSAVARVVGPSGTREIAVEDFCVAPGRNALQPGEFLIDLFLPKPAPGSKAHYLRFIPRNEMDIAVVGVGVFATIADDGRISAARLALAAVAPTPLFVREVSGALVGQAPSADLIAKAASIAREAAQPISDMRAPAEYRRHLCGVLSKRALTAVLQ